MQVLITTEEIHAVITGFELTVAGWIGKWVIHAMLEQTKTGLNKIITDNVNRVAMDVGKLLAVHTQEDATRFEALEWAMRELLHEDRAHEDRRRDDRDR